MPTQLLSLLYLFPFCLFALHPANRLDRRKRRAGYQIASPSYGGLPVEAVTWSSAVFVLATQRREKPLAPLSSPLALFRQANLRGALPSRYRWLPSSPPFLQIYAGILALVRPFSPTPSMSLPLTPVPTALPRMLPAHHPWCVCRLFVATTAAMARDFMLLLHAAARLSAGPVYGRSTARATASRVFGGNRSV